MRPRERRIAIGAGLAVLVAVVAVGILLARGQDGGAEPVAVAETSAATGATSGTVRSDDEQALELSGVDPITGEPVRLADFEGTPIVLNFWASWCPPCREELPALVEFAQKHPEAAVVGVNLQDVPEGARALQEETGFTWPSIADPDARIASQLGLVGMPTTYFLDERHVVRGSVTGATDFAGFEEGLALATGR